MTTETRARRRIRLAVESRGYQLTSLEWEPWSMGGEKEGICGGWHGTTDRPYMRNSYPGDEIMGLSVEEVLAWVDAFIDPPESCECDGPRFPMNPTKGKPRRGRHDPDCKWYIRYHLPWWDWEATRS